MILAEGELDIGACVYPISHHEIIGVIMARAAVYMIW